MNKTLLYGSNTLIGIILFGLVLVLINVLPSELKAVRVFGARIPLQGKIDLTQNKRYTLTDQTTKLLHNLQTPVTAIGFAKSGSMDYINLEAVLKQYAFETPDFQYDIVDPERNMMIARKYGIQSMRTLVLESKGHQER
jgi:hypothetical protein